MSRGGRGGRGRGGRKGPLPPEIDDFSDDDFAPKQKKPQALFPDVNFPVPRPPSQDELHAVTSALSFQKRVRTGPFYATLDPSSIADEKTGKILKRAGFDPFNDQERYTAKYRQKKKTVPDLKAAGREYALKYFPQELWSTLDPEHKNPLWKTMDVEMGDDFVATKRKSLKRKRNTNIHSLDENDEDDTAMKDVDADEDGHQTDDSDPLISSSRRARTLSKAARKKRRGARDRTGGSREKRGLDAEDEYGSTKKKGPSPPSSMRAKEKERKRQEAALAGVELEHEHSSDDDDENEARQDHDNDSDEEDEEDEDDDELVDSEFEESDDGEADDYNAENYFETGEGDDDDGVGYGAGGDDGGDY